MLGSGRWYSTTVLLFAPDPWPEMIQEFDAIKATFGPRSWTRIQDVSCKPMAELPRLLDDNRPRVLHISAHGGEAGELWGRDEHGEPIPATAESIAALFEHVPGLECVVLTACYSAEPAELIARHVGVAIGARGKLLPQAAKEFSKEFYRQLARDRSVATAFENAKKAAALNNPSAHDLEIHHKDGVDTTRRYLHSRGHRRSRRVLVGSFAVALLAVVVRSALSSTTEPSAPSKPAVTPILAPTATPPKPELVRCLQQVRTSRSDATPDLIAACLRPFVSPALATIRVEDRDESAVADARVTAIAKDGNTSDCTTGDDGTCSLNVSRVLADDDVVSLRAQTEDRWSKTITLDVGELRRGGSKITLQPVPVGCTVIVVESAENDTLLRDIRALEIVTIERKHHPREQAGIWTFPCSERELAGPVEYVIQRKSQIRTRPFSTMDRYQRVPWNQTSEQP